jgi:uncharacterized protein YceK
MCRSVASCLAAVLACALGGCGTIGNLADFKSTTPFGGVSRDLHATGWLLEETPEAVKKSPAETAGIAVATPIVALDLPLSLAADTITLPVTLPVALMRQGQPDPEAAPMVNGMRPMNGVPNTINGMSPMQAMPNMNGVPPMQMGPTFNGTPPGASPMGAFGAPAQNVPVPRG